MRTLAVVAFVAGLLLAILVMFFGVRRQLDANHTALRRWPLALSSFLVVLGATLYFRTANGALVTRGWYGVALGLGLLAAWAAWAMVRHSATIPSTDPEDDPHFRFQGQVARLVESIEPRAGGPATGRVAFEFDGTRYEFRARWTPGEWPPEQGRADSEVVIERVDDDLAYVEPWAAIEERL
jgi:hypothetical protein